VFKITKYTYTNNSVRIDWLNGTKESVTVFAEFSRSKMAQQENGDKPRRAFHRCWDFMGVNVNEHHGQARGAGTAAFDEPPSSFALAHAAIAAMREPTQEMLDAWIRAPGAIKEGWQGMIDAALEGKWAALWGPSIRNMKM
jgi:hypothetical protein